MNKTDVTRCEQTTLTILSKKRGDDPMKSVVPPGEGTGYYHEYSPPPILPIHANILPDIQVTIVAINCFAKTGPIL